MAASQARAVTAGEARSRRSGVAGVAGTPTPEAGSWEAALAAAGEGVASVPGVDWTWAVEELMSDPHGPALHQPRTAWLPAQVPDRLLVTDGRPPTPGRLATLLALLARRRRRPFRVVLTFVPSGSDDDERSEGGAD